MTLTAADLAWAWGSIIFFYRFEHPDLDLFPEVGEVFLLAEVKLPAGVLEAGDVVGALAQRHLDRGAGHHLACSKSRSGKKITRVKKSVGLKQDGEIKNDPENISI